jgi:hypothetical protein
MGVEAMSRSVEVARAEVQRAFTCALELAEADQRRRFWEFETELWSLLLALGRALISLYLVRQSLRPRPAAYSQAGLRFALDGERTSALGTRCGKVDFTRPVGRRVGHPTAAADLPVDRELGLCAGFSVGVVMAITRLCAQMAFVPARSTFRYFHGWSPSSRAVLRMVDTVGGEVRPFLENLPAPKDDGSVLVLEVDGGGAPMMSRLEYARRARRREKRRRGTRRNARRARRRSLKRERRGKGEKSKNAKVAFVGVIYTLRKTPEGYEGPINKRVYATFESHEALFIWLLREATKRGYGRRRCLFIADGSEHIWRLQTEYFPLAEACLDWYHVVEKLWVAGTSLFPEGSAALKAWVGRQKKYLRRGRIHALLRDLIAAYRSIPKTGPGNKGKRDRLAAVVGHLFHQRHRMPYHVLRDQDLIIGSGAIEGAVRNLVRMRLDGPGMRWGRGRAECVLLLRCILLNGLWEELSQHVATSGVRLAAAPVPAEPYEARPRMAA